MTEHLPDLESFRARVKIWLAANFPASLASDPDAQTARMRGLPENPAAKAWREAIGSVGWGTPTWPSAYGGGGLAPVEAQVLAAEMAQVGAVNPIGGMGVMMFGPTLMEYGSEALKQQHLPGIVRGEVRWCQGYSEPNAGSDLASLQTRAEDRGDHWLVNGAKIWTSGAHLADWCFCLVRTDPARKHEGISFLLIDMRSAGVETRQIKLINGASTFCETFLTDVAVPKAQLFGPLNGGWTVAKRLLQFERNNISSGLSGGSIGAGAAALTPLQAAITYVGRDEAGRLADPDLRQRLTRHLVDNHAFQLTVRRGADETRAGQGPNNTAAALKAAGAAIAQERNELVILALGLQGLGWDTVGYQASEIDAVRTWLRSKGNSIEGGTSEINLNVVAKRVLGLPDAQRG